LTAEVVIYYARIVLNGDTLKVVSKWLPTPGTITVVLAILLAGCTAEVTHQADTNDATATGIRYYESAPYLIVYSDGHGGLLWQIRYLPDQSRLMTATPKVSGAHVETTMYFQNGILASSSTVGDTTELPKAIIATIQNAIPLLAAAAEGQTRKGFPAPYIYKLVVKDNTITFLGGEGNTNVQVPVVYSTPQ